MLMCVCTGVCSLACMSIPYWSEPVFVERITYVYIGLIKVTAFSPIYIGDCSGIHSCSHANFSLCVSSVPRHEVVGAMCLLIEACTCEVPAGKGVISEELQCYIDVSMCMCAFGPF